MAGIDDVHDLIVLIGTCVIGTWLFDIVREASARSDPPFEFHFGDADHVLLDLGRNAGVPRTLVMVGPGRKVMDTIMARTARVLAVVDDPVDSVRFLQQQKAIDFLPALREQTRYASAHFLLFENPVVRLIQRGWNVTAHTVIDTVLVHLGYRLPSEQRTSLLKTFGGPLNAPWSFEEALQKVDGSISLERVGNIVPAQHAVTVREALSPLLRSALTRDIGVIIWNRSVFLFADQSGVAAPPVVDVTGSARILFFGPYLYLPGGTWAVRLVIAFSRALRGTPFTFKIFSFDTPLVKLAFRPAEDGAFECTFELRHVAPERWLEIHLANDEGVIEGHVALGRTEFSRLDP